MLPSRIERPSKLPPKGEKRTGRWKSQKHRDFVRSFNCCVPDCPGRPIEVCHIRVGTDGGMGRKPSDFFTISLCGGADGHHAEQHRIGEISFADKYGLDLLAMAEEFCRHSPVSQEIRRVKQGGEGG